MNPDNASVSIQAYEPIGEHRSAGRHDRRHHLQESDLALYVPFTGTYGGSVYPSRLGLRSRQATVDVINEFRQNSVGTGPYVVESFSENDRVIYKINENYREPNKPFFATANLKGAVAMQPRPRRLVLQTGDWDYA